MKSLETVMAKKNCANTTRHVQYYGPDGLTDEILIDWYEKCQPVGSGPLGIARMLCAVIEELAAQRGIELPPAQGLKS